MRPALIFPSGLACVPASALSGGLQIAMLFDSALLRASVRQAGQRISRLNGNRPWYCNPEVAKQNENAGFVPRARRKPCEGWPPSQGLQRRQGCEDALSCFDIFGLQYQRPQGLLRAPRGRVAVLQRLQPDLPLIVAGVLRLLKFQVGVALRLCNCTGVFGVAARRKSILQQIVVLPHPIDQSGRI